MERKWRNGVYISMMSDSLRKKAELLQEIYDNTKAQEKLLKSGEPDVDEFMRTLDEKGNLIEQLTQMDEGFDALFQKVKKEITEHREDYHDQISRMQDRIRHISGLSAQIQALERQNSERVKAFLAKKREQIRNRRIVGKTASNYYSHMNNTHRAEQSYFLNETK